MTKPPLIITCAVVGAELSRQDTPHLPITPQEIAQSAIEAVAAGASIIHLHVRDKKGLPSQESNIFRQVSELIKQECDCILQYSTGGAVGTPVEARCAPLKLKPEMATLSMGSMNFGREIFENSEQTICTIAKTLQQYGVVPELEIFDAGMLESTFRYLKRSDIPAQFHIDFVLGVPGGIGGEVEDLLYLLNKLPPEQSWSVAGIGRFQLPLTAHAIAIGGHVRTGFEDNIYYQKRVLATSNAQLVERVVNLAGELNRPIASPVEAREILHIPAL
ncbi:MAG: 3-keto-5-aminohexanoate cleavage protein [Candidatus Polarisedimenticolaceae bacterium]|nr:3-keto-5-aminohexanoate cleavage protein [Candidatus Polarisedimenticolaceae bacterium]